jgi:hypothetical protein
LTIQIHFCAVPQLQASRATASVFKIALDWSDFSLPSFFQSRNGAGLRHDPNESSFVGEPSRCPDHLVGEYFLTLMHLALLDLDVDTYSWLTAQLGSCSATILFFHFFFH